MLADLGLEFTLVKSILPPVSDPNLKIKTLVFSPHFQAPPTPQKTFPKFFFVRDTVNPTHFDTLVTLRNNRDPPPEGVLRRNALLGHYAPVDW